MPESLWVRHPGRPPVLPMQVFVVALVLAVISAGVVPLIAAARLSWLASVIFSILTLIAAQHIARRLRVGDPARRFWWAICVNAVTSATGYLIQLLMARTDSGLLLRTIPTVIIGLGVVVLVVVMCTYPLRIQAGRPRACFWLDMATVMVGAAAFAYYFAPTEDGRTPGVLSMLAGPVVMLVAVFALARLLMGGQPPFTPWTGALGGVAATIGGITGVWGPSMVSGGAGRWLLTLSAAGDAVMMVAIWLQRSLVEIDPKAFERPRGRTFSVLPYVALASTFTLLAIALTARGLDEHSAAVLGGATLSTGLVVVRQMASFTDNARLLRDLDITVAELQHTAVGLRSAIADRDELTVKLHQMAYQDSLTGLANRALFHDQLALHLLRSRREGLPITVILLDLDHFKPINDRFGHAAGDAVLQEIGRRLRDGLREADTVARLGGDEFAILLDSTMPNDVNAITERITRVVREPCVVAGASLTVGVSIGSATGRAGEYDADRLLKEADAAMYAAKSQSRPAYPQPA